MISRGVSVIPKSNSPERIAANFDCIFELEEIDFATIDNVLGSPSEPGVRNLETRDYLGFDSFNEEVEEP
jgi:diketogulonate reductase-like aldo/keto reductase